MRFALGLMVENGMKALPRRKKRDVIALLDCTSVTTRIMDRGDTEKSILQGVFQDS